MAGSQYSITDWYIFWRRGDRSAGDELYGITFRTLRTIAARLLAREQFDHTLQPTALVHEFFLKLFGRGQLEIQDERHFFNTAARTMGQVLVDRARRRNAAKRIPPEAVPVLLGYLATGSEASLDVKLVLHKLAELDPAVADTLWLCYVEGMTFEEVADLHGVARWRVRERCAFGKKWMADRLTVQAGSRRSHTRLVQSPASGRLAGEGS